jgi:hypothetical protein
VSGWFLVVVVTWGGYVNGQQPTQLGPFATAAACERAGAALVAASSDQRDAPLLDRQRARWVCLPRKDDRLAP